MFDIAHDKYHFHELITAIYEHAAKVSDERMFWVGLFSAIVSFLAICTALCISNRQLKQQIDISFFKERNELYDFLQKLCYFGSQQKIILEKYEVVECSNRNMKIAIWLKVFPKLLKFTPLLKVQRDFEDSYENKQNNLKSTISNEDISNVQKIIAGVDYVSLARKDYDRRYEDCHIELINTLSKIMQIVWIFKLNKKNLHALKNIHDRLQNSFRDIDNEAITAREYKEKILQLCSDLEQLNIWDDVKKHIDLVGVYKKRTFVKLKDFLSKLILCKK